MAKLLCIVGARPNFMKIAPVMSALKQHECIDAKLIHTGQHYDVEMNEQFFTELNIPKPDLDLNVGSASHAVQTAEIMRRFEPVLDHEKPTAVLVVGDVNSTIACALVAVKKGIDVIHVEAGLRSFDRSMPEEINRILTDQIADLLFITEKQAQAQLLKEAVAEHKIHFVGNVMIDTLLHNLPRATKPEKIFQHSGVAKNWGDQGYAVLTMHRPSNVDDKEKLSALLLELKKVSDKIPIIFPVHPRTKRKLEEFGLYPLLDTPRFLLTGPLGYLDMLGLNANATLVLTDSGGIQEETTALNVPCVTLRENTERPITVNEGTNTIVGTDPDKIHQAVANILQHGVKKGRIPEGWDGQAAIRIAEILKQHYC